MSESKQLLSNESTTMSNGSTAKKQQASSSTKSRRSWKEIKTTVEFSRKLMFALNTDSPSNIVFGEGVQKNSERVYYLGGTRKRDVTIKYIDMVAGGGSLGEKLVGEALLDDSFSIESGSSTRQLTKEEQLLRERKRCSFNGITSFCLEPSRRRLVFSENSDLFYFDDNGTTSTEQSILTASKGAIDVKICPNNADLISYILNDNVYVQELTSRREFKLTSSVDPLKSGVPSYAVQEEFNRYTGYWWQPQSSTAGPSTTYRIVYEEVDDGCVDLIYISPSCESEFGVDTYRYPKAGTKNSRTELRMAEFTFSDIESGKPKINCKIKRMQKSFYELFSWYEYLVRGEWTPDGQYFWALIYDRLQQRGQSMLIPAEFFVPADNESNDQQASMETSAYLDESKDIILLEEQTSDSWINFHNTIYFLNQQPSDEKKIFSYVTALEDSGYLHLYLFKLSLQAADLELVTDGVLRSKSLEKIQLTSGDWCVEYNENINVDEANSLIYFTGYKDPLESHLYVVNYNEPNKIRQLTSNGYSHKITMNKKCNYFITICSNLSTQQKTYMYELSNQGNKSQGVDSLILKQVAQIVSREELKASSSSSSSSSSSAAISIDMKTAELKSQYASVNSLLGLNLDALVVSNPSLDSFTNVVQHLFKPPQIFTFSTDDGCKLYGMIYMPHNYEHGNKYPTLLYIYGGPKVQLVNNSYKANKYPRFNILALLGYCVVVVDSRGSDYRGKVFETHLNRKMEISDQVKGLEWASRIFNCIDMKRVGIFGWSYGGYMALMGLAQRPDIFKVAISGAPVTTWNLYDTAYTERYMGLPDENRKSYDDGSVLSWAKSFPDEENRLLIIHGMIDENVHFAHTRKLIDALIKENKPYQLQVYPNERHGIRSPDASLHCDINLYSFLEQHL